VTAELLRREPFRLFFPVGILLAWVGIGHWVLYTTGVTSTYSCQLHGLVQMQGFMMAFAVGFLWTAIPRRTGTSPASRAEISAALAALVATTGFALAERWMLSELAYAALLVLLLVFALRRFLADGAARRPPAAFVLIPLGLLHGLAGSALIAVSTLPSGPAWMMGLGRLLVQQGVFLCFALGVGALILPLMNGTPPPADLSFRDAAAYACAGALIFASLVLEHAGSVRGGPLLRAAVVAVGLGLGAGAWRRPARPGLHRRLVWLAAWLMPLGLAASGLWPDYRVPALHVLFIGGFSLLALAIATHVALSHLGLDALASGNPPAVVVLGACFLLAMLARVAADASHTYFAHVGWAAGVWILGSAVWLAFLAPKLLRADAGGRER
jgi:uncharacterized protein involved in response to NO